MTNVSRTTKGYLSFKRDIIENLKDDEFYINEIEGVGTFKISKKDFYNVFADITKTSSWEGGEYHYPKNSKVLERNEKFLTRYSDLIFDDYSPNISKEQWIELINDKTVFNEKSLITFACIKKAKLATCADMAEEFGRDFNFYNTNNWRTGERVYRKTNCPISIRDSGEKVYWNICCLGCRTS